MYALNTGTPDFDLWSEVATSGQGYLADLAIIIRHYCGTGIIQPSTKLGGVIMPMYEYEYL
jgi:hypothetical protein